jgi:cytoskeletal protein CcmA (bactofilin family)
MAETGNTEFSTVIGPDASFKGDLTFEKGMRLHGKLSGTVTTAGRLHVAKEATCEAEVQAGSIIIEGEVRGNLTANDRIEMKPTTRYEGDLTTAKLVVEEGAQFKGHVTVGPDAVKTKPQGGGGAGGARMGSALPPAQVQGQAVK